MKKSDRTKIVYEGYVLEHETTSTERYNLLKVKTKQEGRLTKAENIGDEYETTEAYGVTLERGLFLIIQDIMAEKGMEYSLKEYIEEWRRERQALTNALSDVNEPNN